MPAMSRGVRGTLLTLAGGALWGLSGTASKYLMATYGMDPLWLSCVRQLGACALFLLASVATAREQLVGVLRSPRDLLAAVVVALTAVLLMQVSYLEAIAWTNSATATVLQSLGTIVVLGYSCVRARRRPRMRERVGVALALAGTFVLATGGDVRQLAMPPEGLAWGLACAVCNALLSIVPARLMARWGNFVVNGLTMGVAGACLSAWVRPWACAPALDGAGVALLVAVVVLGTFGAYALYLQGVRDVGSMKAILLGTSEPLVATAASIAWLGTAFAPTDLLGFALVIAMVYVAA